MVVRCGRQDGERAGHGAACESKVVFQQFCVGVCGGVVGADCCGGGALGVCAGLFGGDLVGVAVISDMAGDVGKGGVEGGFCAGVACFYDGGKGALSVLAAYTCRALGSFRAGLALGALHTLDALGALLALLALRAGLTLHTLGALGALGSGRALELANGCPVSLCFGPDVALPVGFDHVHLVIAVGNGVFQRGKGAVNVLDVEAGTILTRGTGRALGTSGALCAYFPLRTLGAGRALLTLFSLHTLYAGDALDTLWASGTLCALFALDALRTLRPTDRHGLGRNGAVLDGEGHDAVCVDAGNDAGAGGSSVALVALHALDTLFSLWASVAFYAVDDGLGAVVGNFAVVKLHPSALGQGLPGWIHDDVTSRPGCLPGHAVLAGLQYPVSVQTDVLEACPFRELYARLHAQRFQSRKQGSIDVLLDGQGTFVELLLEFGGGQAAYIVGFVI